MNRGLDIVARFQVLQVFGDFFRFGKPEKPEFFSLAWLGLNFFRFSHNNLKKTQRTSPGMCREHRCCAGHNFIPEKNLKISRVPGAARCARARSVYLHIFLSVPNEGGGTGKCARQIPSCSTRRGTENLIGRRPHFGCYMTGHFGVHPAQKRGLGH